MQKRLFTIDGFLYAYIGYTSGYLWNGWATPYFEREEAIKVMEGYNECRDETEKMTYDEETDTFAAWVEGYEGYEYWKGEDIQTEEGIKHLYGIGAYSWIWDYTTEEDALYTAQQIQDFILEYGNQRTVEEIKCQLKDLETFRRTILVFYRGNLSAEEKFKKLGGILKL